MKTKLIMNILAASMLVCAGSAFAEGRKDKESPRANLKWGAAGDRPVQIIDRAIETHKALKRTNPDGIPSSVTDRAKCIAIVPGLVTAAAVVGGSHGDGVAVCRTETGWSKPAFIDFDSASVGMQVGAKSTDVVMYFMSERAERALKNGSFGAGADASVVAGNFDRTFDMKNADVVAYQSSSGAFVGASLGGGKITSDNDTNTAFYGKEFQAAEILSGRVDTNNPSAERLISQIR